MKSGIKGRMRRCTVLPAAPRQEEQEGFSRYGNDFGGHPVWLPWPEFGHQTEYPPELFSGSPCIDHIARLNHPVLRRFV